MGIGMQVVIYLSAGLLAVLLIGFTVHSTNRDNHNPSPKQFVKPSDLLKVLITFLQYLVIVGSLSVPWPTALSYLFNITKFVFAAVNGQVGSVSLDCVLPQGPQSSVPVSIQRQLIFLVAPIGIVIGVFLLFAAKAMFLKALRLACRIVKRMRSTSASSGSHFQQQASSTISPLLMKVPLMCVLTSFFSYPFLVRVSLGMFACVQLDKIDAPDDPYPQFASADASHGYWIHAMQQACFEGWHLRWAMALGLPCVLLFCLVIPISLGISLNANWASMQGAPVQCSLYRPYADNRCWWEGMILLQTSLLVTVSVFRYALGGFYSALLISVMFSGMATLQLVLKPFASRELHIMQLLSFGCLYITSCIGCSLFSVDTLHSSHVYKEAMGALAVCVNVGFMIWCCYNMMAVSQGFLGRVFAALKRLGARCCPSLCGSARSSSSGSSGGRHGINGSGITCCSLSGSGSIPDGSVLVLQKAAHESVPASNGGDIDKTHQIIAQKSPAQLPVLPNV
jgi:hypothetical protein